MLKFPKLFSTLLASLLLLSSAFAQSEKERINTYISQYADLAIREMLRTGVPASITLAQGIHETAGGQSDLAAFANNHFGIKCREEWKGETMAHDDDSKAECFRKYASVEESYKDHSEFLKRPHYAFLFKLDPTDFEGWAKGLKKAGYATNPVYAQKLIKIIVDNNLQQYTLLAMERRQGNESNAFAYASNNQKADDLKNAVSKIREVLADAKIAAKQNLVKASSLKKGTYPLNAIFNINEARVILAPAGSSLFAIATNYNVAYKKLLEFNDLDEAEIFMNDQLIFLQKKLKRGRNDFHIIEENEDLHDVAQKEGIQLSSVLEFNHLQKGMIPAVGEKIYLKSPAPASPKLASANLSGKSISM